MREKPPLADDQIVTCLLDRYGLSASAIEFLPLGFDSAAGVYRVQAGDRPYFVKVKAGPPHVVSLHLPHELHRQGFTQVIPSLSTLDGALWAELEGFTLVVYPFIEGRSAMDVGMTDSHWIELGMFLKRLHTVSLPPDLLAQIPRETFAPEPKYATVVTDIHAVVNHHLYTHPVAAQLAEFWREQHAAIGALIERVAQLGEQLAAEPLAPVLCHADIHTANLLLTDRGELFVVDWDQPVLAPKERDLLFVTVGDYVKHQREQDLVFQGYGPAELNPLASVYYRYARVLEDLGGFGEVVFLMDVSDDSRRDAAEWFRAQFAPGWGLDAAHQLDRDLGLTP